MVTGWGGTGGERRCKFEPIRRFSALGPSLPRIRYLRPLFQTLSWCNQCKMICSLDTSRWEGTRSTRKSLTTVSLDERPHHFQSADAVEEEIVVNDVFFFFFSQLDLLAAPIFFFLHHPVLTQPFPPATTHSPNADLFSTYSMQASCVRGTEARGLLPSAAPSASPWTTTWTTP